MRRQLVDPSGAHITTAPKAVPQVDGGFLPRRVPEDSWREQLAQFSPITEQVPYLWLDWLPGIPEARVQRWALWEVMPAAMCEKMIISQRVRGLLEDEIILASILRDLNEAAPPNDPSRGKWVTDRRSPIGKKWSSDSLVNQQQWELWRELRGFATLCWIIQGQHGGHKRGYSEHEEVQLRRLKLPCRAPFPGMLSYAPFDRRVTEQLERFDRLRSWEGDFTRRVASHQNAVQILESERAKARAQAEADADEWLSLQMQAVLDEVPQWRVANIAANLPVADEADRPILIRGGV